MKLLRKLAVAIVFALGASIPVIAQNAATDLGSLVTQNAIANPYTPQATDLVPLYRGQNGVAGFARYAIGDIGSAWLTFTPTITCGTGTVAGYTTQNGRYKIIGKTVFLNVIVQASGAGTCTGTFTIAGLPVVAQGSAAVAYQFSVIDGSSFNFVQAYTAGGTGTIPVNTAGGGNPTVTDQIRVTGVYESV